ncbi:pyruvate dehydrogenase complex dihydrolipoamide acetyltransferase [Pseudomonas sp. Y39-6]|uniref:pyruvate dehydrogenase complex dihydrolipoamide acetyltransferase n=1 Tax=Pseudomonas sp. Y39-6 TaxID=2749807 RepID=UPI0019100B8A|nr:pyruvate dehydrogenase complex dihydrolipoamide acetyltransferase [Pseudomonas sp. Y39-6]QPO22968.1 pyruvate dehydrogenase complex dihydrolipoamide acetyltransferase [Pseudomonas sp. Y39-6]URS60292.1 pyruvate dehydrogenase complex dihydrolipoamide acetyltransferase [Pseudomonas sp. Y39-6]
MAKLLHMPEVSANATHAAIQNWTLKEGDTISAGDCIAEIETEKALVELAAEEDAVLGKILVEPGREVEVGAPIGVLFARGETDVDIAALLAKAGALAAANEPVVDDAPVLQPRAEVTTAIDAHSGRIFASPLARRLAAAKGLDLASLKGSGPNGRIVKRDVEAVAVAAAVAAPTPVSTVDFDEIPHSSMRKTIARRLVESKATVPHFYLDVECRMEPLLALREQVNRTAARKISINDFIVKAAAVALQQVPAMNVTWTETALHRYHQADVCVAVSTESGLITPVVRNADSKALSQISAQVAELAGRARDGRLRPEEYQGGSFTISNLGMFGVEQFSAIINPPHAAILAVGATQQKPVVENGELKVGAVLRCTLSVDHRAVDGALAAQWLAVFKGLMENPLGMLI